MCESISVVADVSDVTNQFQIDNVLSYVSNRYEIKPTQSVSAVVVRNNKRLLDEFRWGLMPFWAKESVWMDSSSISDKRIFQRIIKKQRCIIPCSAFYVTTTENKSTRWVKVTMRSGTFGIAALYDEWHSASTDEELRTCTMFMTRANSIVSPYHHQMPAILEGDEIDEWLKPDLKDPYRIKSMLRPMEELRMTSYILASPKDKFEPVTEPELQRPELA
ncbi:SOS response-associated peptidase [Paenibacillus piri]|uniref:SOS response-associated peptidase n=1 Tax=Paenibacillus piri TaxID=2547395 RepID=UPI0014042C51|nr:SOS response-associated peptidase family protein [Paenibacillus piri]